jgi:hypothetical protein
MPAEQVPHFGQHDWKENGSRGRLGLIEWLVPQGLYYFDLEFEAEQLINWRAQLACHHLISGISPRGTRHACVGFGGTVVHDPHPSRLGIIPEEGKWLVGYIVKG